jgi:hypothetical protein
LVIDRLKNIFNSPDKKEEPPVELPAVPPFDSQDTETAPVPIHRPDHVKMNINHAGHMRVVARNDDEAVLLEAESLKRTREKKTILYGEDAISAYIPDFPLLKFMTITKNGDTLCTFPFLNTGKPIDVRITEITECENGFEGQLEMFTKGSSVTFFDTLYFKNKNKYFPGKDARVLLSGIAYVLTKIKAAPVENNKKKAPETQEQAGADLAFKYANGDVDDYVFRGKVKEVQEFSVLGKKAQVIRVPLRISHESVIDIYVCATENAIRERLRVGDHVSGILWLQGFAL